MIKYYENERIFKLDTPMSSYIIGVVDEEGFLGHIYYGKRISDHDVSYLLKIDEQPFVPSKFNRDRSSFYDCFPMEYPTHGIGDFRNTCLEVRSSDGHYGCCLQYISHMIYKGKRKLEGLPATFGTEEECQSLEITCMDPVLGLKIILTYSAFEELDVITRSVRLVNEGNQPIYVEKVLSACLDLENKDYEMISMHGSWARERHVQRRSIGYGTQSTGSIRGETSHQEHPFIAILPKSTTEDAGEVYGMHFVYSGNFIAEVQRSQFDSVRAIMGINGEGFCWKLNVLDTFEAPEVVMVYSCEGLGQMSRTLHNLYRNHLIRSKYKDQKRPILINNWEATYFNFTTDKLLDIAREAAKDGIEMLVMDDGWFGSRNDDNTSLGDWFVNEEKLKGGIKYLVDEVNKLGLKFGIWFEPEMVSPVSKLYEEHRDWAIQIPGRSATLCRNQYVLDVSRKEVRDYVFEMVSKILRSANIEYVKWDMNRQLTDLGSYGLPKDQQGELYHRYVLGVYELQERLITEFPDLLLENCSGGGARFDPGMLYYSPQIWCSDDTDAIERLAIQQGTAMIYPLSSMGAHVSASPNHVLGRHTPFSTRGYVALAGTFGYELDITKLSSEDREIIPKQVEMYHKYNDLVREGDYYRIASYHENHQYDCWMVVSKDKKEALFTFIQVLNRPNYHSRRIYMKGLDHSMKYENEETGQILYGDTLMNGGINIESMWGDFQGKLIHYKAVE